MSNSADSRPLETSDRRSALRKRMPLVGALVGGASLLYLPTLLMSQAPQTEAGPPIVKASDKWITLGVDASSSQIPTTLSQYEVVRPIAPIQHRPSRKDRMQVTSGGSQGVHSRAQLSGKPFASSVASALPNVTQRGASDRPNSVCASNRQHAASFRIAKNQRQWSRPSTVA